MGILILSVLITPLSAQGDNRISCVAFVKEDSIMLRWVPTSLPVWQSGIEHGYIIKRYTISRAGEFIPDGLSNGKLLNPSPIRPASADHFDLLASSDTRASVVQEAIYGSDFRQNADNFTNFIKSYEEFEARLGFALFMCDMSSGIADAAGLYFSDTGILGGERYAYRISLANTPEEFQVEPAVIVVDADELTQLPIITDIQTIFLDRTVKFNWPVYTYKGIYSAYIIEKSNDGKDFKTISELPLVNFSEEENPDYFIYTDSLQNNKEEVFYRVRGISPFGLAGPSSKTISGKGMPEFTSYASIDTATIIDNKRITLRWRISESEKSPVEAVNILRSNVYNGPYEQINTRSVKPGTKFFTDEKPLLSNYYQIMLIGKNDLKSYSFPYYVQIEDNEPPYPPQDLSGNVDSAGVVSIVWKSNSEPDLLGYKVFRANSPDDEFISLDREISNENLCIDSISLNTLSSHICYQVVAIDRNYNNSEYSQLLVLTRPDSIPPAPAVITGLHYEDKKVTCVMEESPSSDIKSYELFMQVAGDSTTTMVGSWEKLPAATNNEIFIDGLIEFRLVSIDKKGNKSQNSRIVYVPESGQETIFLTADQAPDGNRIILNWNIPADFNPVKTLIYRGEGDNIAGIYATIPDRALSFEDENTIINNSYTYRVILYGDSKVFASGKLLFIPKQKTKTRQ